MVMYILRLQIILAKKSSGHECLQGTGKEFTKRPAKYQLWFTFYMLKFQYSCKQSVKKIFSFYQQNLGSENVNSTHQPNCFFFFLNSKPNHFGSNINNRNSTFQTMCNIYPIVSAFIQKTFFKLLKFKVSDGKQCLLGVQIIALN